MPRNSGGIYTLPGNLFVPNTVISSSEVNSKFLDLGTAMSQSLSRFGEGSMLAPLKLPDGSAAAPTMTWESDATTGFYLAAASTFRAVVASTTAQEWNSTGVSISKPLTTGNTSVGGTLGVTGTSTLSGPINLNGTTRVNAKLGLNVTPTFPFEVGDTGAVGNALARFGSNMVPFFILGNGGFNYTGIGFNCYFNATDQRVVAGFCSDIAQSSDGAIRVRTGGTGAAGAVTLTEKLVIPQTATATAAAPTAAIQLPNGHLSLDGAVAPASTVAMKNTLTPANIVKAWGVITTNGSGTATLVDGFNVASVGFNAGRVVVTFAQSFTNSNYAASATWERDPFLRPQTFTASTMFIQAFQFTSGPPAQFNALALETEVAVIRFMAVGKQ